MESISVALNFNCSAHHQIVVENEFGAHHEMITTSQKPPHS